MRTIAIISIVLVTVIISSCNKEKRLMDDLVGNWEIDKSEKFKLLPGGVDSLYEELENAGSIVIYEDADNPSKTSKLYDFMFIDANQDTLEAKNTLISDEKNKRLILSDALSDSLGNTYDLVWTIEKTKNNKQVWQIYGVDSTFFYPPNNNNPGDASNWLLWKLTLKRE